jgi:alpha-tubulin suppressor-like RCC1 family protein
MMSVAGGDQHSLALKRDGTVWAWGLNANGQLGNGTTTNSTVPVAVSGLANVVAISAGGNFSLALKGDGTVWAWGSNLFDQLGDNGVTFLTATLPVRVFGLTNITAISAGYAHSIARRGDGAVFTWGQNLQGQLGDGTTAERIAPVQVPGVSGAVAVSTGVYNTHAILGDGRVFAWGSNATGQLGAGLAVFKTVPELVPGLTDIVAISAGFESSFAVRSDGRLFAWGGNGTGQLGDGTLTNRSTPVLLPGIDGVVAVSAGFDHTLALRNDGTVRAWGDNIFGEAGPGQPAFGAFTPGPVPGITQAVAVSAGFLHSLVLKSDGTVVAFGYNGYGQLGDGTLTSRSTPVTVSGLTNVTAISAAFYHSLALRSDGTVAAWGSNSSGQLGDGTFVDRLLPVNAAGLSIAAVSVAWVLSSRWRDGTIAWGPMTPASSATARAWPTARRAPVVGLFAGASSRPATAQPRDARRGSDRLATTSTADRHDRASRVARGDAPRAGRGASPATTGSSTDPRLRTHSTDKIPVFVVAAPVALDCRPMCSSGRRTSVCRAAVRLCARAGKEVVAAKRGRRARKGYAAGRQGHAGAVCSRGYRIRQLQAVSASSLRRDGCTYRAGRR